MVGNHWSTLLYFDYKINISVNLNQSSFLFGYSAKLNMCLQAPSWPITNFYGSKHLKTLPQILMETNTREFDCGLSGFLRFLVFELSGQNKIGNIFVIDEAIKKCEYGLKFPLNQTYVIIHQQVMKFFRPQITKNCVLVILVFIFYAKSYSRTCPIVLKF